MATSPTASAPKVGFLSANPLCRILDERDPQLAACLLEMQERSLNNWLSLLVPDQGSHAGLLHLFNVGRNIDKMIPEEQKSKLTSGEIFLLLAAVLLHDIGRTVPGGRAPHDDLGFKYCPGEPNCKTAPVEQTKCSSLHWDHHIKSRDIIVGAGFELGLPNLLAMEYCGLLAYCHRLDEPPWKDQKVFGDVPDCQLKLCKVDRFRNTSIEPFGAVRIPLLAALLRIADEAENHWTRACPNAWGKLLNVDQQPSAKEFRRYVEDVEFAPAGKGVVMHLPASPADKLLVSFARNASELEKVLAAWAGELKPLGIDYRQVYFEWEGSLHRIVVGEDKKPTIVKKLLEVFPDDVPQIKDLAQALVRLSRSTMGHREFPWSAFEAEVGRPLRARDRWLVDRMAEQLPRVLHVDKHRELVVVNADQLDQIEERCGLKEMSHATQR